jgi:acetylornithine/succinyldiaminopimelate/putrescine aminotransferase
MLAMDLTEPLAAELVGAARERGLLVNNTGPHTVRMVPALNITLPQIDVGLQLLREALNSL